MSYAGRFGFMGLFIMRADMRRRGIGAHLWHWRRDALLSRLATGASVGMDGVFEMVPFYERGGFKPAYRHLRFQGTASALPGPEVESLGVSNFDEVELLDSAYVVAPRSTFLRRWLDRGGIQIAGVREGGCLVAYGMARPCRVGVKMGPLFAERPAQANAIFAHLLRCFAGQQVQIDVPEPNEGALGMVKAAGFTQTFGCVRLYHGGNPALPVRSIYGVTSLEFG